MTQEELLENAMVLLDAARCPDCDGKGSIASLIRSRQLVTREMAADAGDPSMEGSLYCDDEWELKPCQWCHEKKRLIAEMTAQPKL